MRLQRDIGVEEAGGFPISPELEAQHHTLFIVLAPVWALLPCLRDLSYTPDFK